MLKHLTLGGSYDALAGDLSEEFEQGRSRGWYWRQVLFAMVIGFLRQLRAHWHTGAFAVLWVGVGATSWFRFLVSIDRSGNFAGSMWKLPWPYSTICEVTMWIASALPFVWIGSALYLLIYSVVLQKNCIQHALRGLLMSAVVWWVSMIAMVLPFFLFVEMHGIASHAYMRLMTDLPLFLGLLASLLFALPSSRDSIGAFQE
jgi:hypothetical protein